MHGTRHAGLGTLPKVFLWQRPYYLNPWFCGEKKTVNLQLLKTDAVIGTCRSRLERLTVTGFSAGIMG
tara:strand:- start:236 stop:439 length:204 start_codon:yes stop_codon:yes gene_type:complete